MTTAKPIGPTFGAELAAAGVLDLPFSWRFDGTIDIERLTPEQAAAVQAVYDVHDPTVQTDPPMIYPPFGVALPDPLPANWPASWRTSEFPPPSPPPPPPPEALRYQVPRLTIIERMMTAHRVDALMDGLADADRITRERWYARDQVWNDDPFVLELIYNASADPRIILARP